MESFRDRGREEMRVLARTLYIKKGESESSLIWENIEKQRSVVLTN